MEVKTTAPAHSCLCENSAPLEKFVLDDLPSVSKATRESPGNGARPAPVSRPSRAMAAASPSVFLLMVTGQVESAQVSNRGPRLGTARSSPRALLSAPREPSHML